MCSYHICIIYYVGTGGIGSVILSEKDIVNLMHLLQMYSYKWNPLGLSLGFTPHELSNISSMLKLLVGAPVSYLQELLSQWLQWPIDSHPSKPTLEALCAALRSSLVGLGSAAEEVNDVMRQSTGTCNNNYVNVDVTLCYNACTTIAIVLELTTSPLYN